MPLLGMEILLTLIFGCCCLRCTSGWCLRRHELQEDYPIELYDDYDPDCDTEKENKYEPIEIILITEKNIQELEKKYNSECCSICLCEYIEGEHLSITGCGHAFHSNCLAEWIMKKPICPMCNTNLITNLSEVPPPYHHDDEIREYSDDGVFP